MGSGALGVESGQWLTSCLNSNGADASGSGSGGDSGSDRLGATAEVTNAENRTQWQLAR